MDIAELLHNPTKRHRKETMRKVMDRITASGIYDVETILSMDRDTLMRLSEMTNRQLSVLENMLIAKGLSLFMPPKVIAHKGIQLLDQAKVRSLAYCRYCEQLRSECQCHATNQYLSYCQVCRDVSDNCDCFEENHPFLWEQLILDRYHGIVSDDI